MTDREFVLKHWPNAVHGGGPDSFIIALNPCPDSMAWGQFDFAGKGEVAIWAEAAEYTRIQLKQVAYLQEEIAICVKLRWQSDAHDWKILPRIINRLRKQLTEAVDGMKMSEDFVQIVPQVHPRKTL